MRAVRSDVFRETHQSSRSGDKISQGKVYHRDTECITKLYLGSRMTDADKKENRRSPCATGTSSPAPRGGLSRPGATPECHTASTQQCAIHVMSVGTVILLWQSHMMHTEANRLRQMDEQFMEVQRVHALVLSFRDESEQLVKARNLARLQKEASALRNQLEQSLRQTQTVFRGIEPNNILDPTALSTRKRFKVYCLPKSIR